MDTSIPDVRLAHNALQCLSIEPNTTPFIHQHVLHYSRPTEIYLEEFCKLMSQITTSTDIEHFADIAFTCKLFWELVAYDPTFELTQFSAWYNKCHVSRRPNALDYIKDFNRLTLFRGICPSYPPEVPTFDIIKSVAAVETAHIVYSHTQATETTVKYHPQLIPLIDDAEFTIRRQPIPVISL